VGEKRERERNGHAFFTLFPLHWFEIEIETFMSSKAAGAQDI
jgi:hypothetical protein